MVEVAANPTSKPKEILDAIKKNPDTAAVLQTTKKANVYNSIKRCRRRLATVTGLKEWLIGDLCAADPDAVGKVNTTVDENGSEVYQSAMAAIGPTRAL
mmetsp:Transcript_24107/g.60367  ORF Transcript_24107/g.60367 Transcript_24107/m.60367 type:complete len:99 (-) Transcript_24107:19-315(-)